MNSLRWKFCMVVLLTASALFADEIIVDHAGTGNFTNIQAAIDSLGTTTGDVVIVKPGTYIENINLKGKAITLRSTDPNNPEIVNSTIIDGNYSGTVISCINGETPDTLIAGFVVRNGNTDSGGGMYNYDSSPSVTRCIFTANYAPAFGGGMANEASACPRVSYCSFINNAGGSGGGMDNWNSSPILYDCSFIRNHAFHQDYGGGINVDGSTPIIINCTFIENVSSKGSGGGMMIWEGSYVVLTNCRFIANSAADQGGAIFNCSSSSSVVNNCMFIANVAGGGGGIENALQSSLIVSNCIFTGNTAVYGGGINNNSGASLMLNNCILWQNGDQIHNLGTSDKIKVSYCDIQNSFSGGTWDTDLGVNGGGNIDADPLFVDIDGDDNILGTVDDNLQLQAGSPCIDAGNNLIAPLDDCDIDNDGITTELIPVDLAGNNRFADDPDTFDTGISSTGVDGVIDMGAYEYALSIEIEGDINGDGDVDIYDLEKFAGQWLSPTCNNCYDGDINEDGDVNFEDFAKLARNWLLETN